MFTKTVDSSPENRVLLIAHRGGEGQWPSNTLFAFAKALAAGADSLEMDIHAAADGTLVVRHDPFVDSTTNGKGFIRDFSLSKLKQLDAGYTWSDDGGESFPFRARGIAIPTLAEVFESFPNTCLNIDIKPKEPQVTHSLCKLLCDFHKLEQVVVGSFHTNQLNLFRRLCPRTRTAAGVSEIRRFLLMEHIFLDRSFHSQAYAFQIPETEGRLRIVSPRFIRAAHSRGLLVHIWTVNEKADMRRLIDWGVDGIMTDFPDRLADVLRN